MNECERCGKTGHVGDNCFRYPENRGTHPDAIINNQNKIAAANNTGECPVVHGRQIATATDGNCLFHALLSVSGTMEPMNHLQCRQAITDFMANNANMTVKNRGLSLQDWVESTEHKTFAEYVEHMKAPGTWAGNVELLCYSRMRQCNVHVYEYEEDLDGRGYRRTLTHDYSTTDEDVQTVAVFYTGYHYEGFVVEESDAEEEEEEEEEEEDDEEEEDLEEGEEENTNC